MKLIVFLSLSLSIIYPGIVAKTYYIQNKTGLNWFGANHLCALQGLQLATVITQNEQDTLAKTIKVAEMEKASFWIGGTDLAKEGTFIWMASGEPFSYTRWLPNQPDNNDANGENCVHIWPDLTNLPHWNDAPCDHIKYFICEEQPKNCYNNEEITVDCEIVKKN